jgi:serine/threonine protein kinase
MLKWIPSEAKKFFSVSNPTEDLPIFAVPNANEQLQPLEVTQIDTTHVELRQLLLSYRHRIAFGIDVGRALAYLHARGIIHRDLKLENLLLTENNRVKVCDFGLSRLVAKSEAERRRMSFCGSDGYMAPELILCLDEYDTSVDVFSLAIILLALFTLKIPSGDGPNEPPPFRRVIPGFGLDPTDIASAVPGTLPNNEKLVQLIQKCTNEDMKKRATVKDVLSVFKETETMICVRLREEEFQMSTSSGRRGTAFPFNVGVPISTAMQRSTQLLGSAASLSSSTTDISPLAPIDTRSRETINLWGPGQQVITSPLSPLSMTRFGYGASAPSLENIASNTTLNESMPKTQSGLPLNRSRHDIPHRFSLVFSALSLQVIRCHYCGKSIQSFMHSHVECDDCGYTSHKKVGVEIMFKGNHLCSSAQEKFLQRVVRNLKKQRNISPCHSRMMPLFHHQHLRLQNKIFHKTQMHIMRFRVIIDIYNDLRLIMVNFHMIACDELNY